jgi:transposase
LVVCCRRLPERFSKFHNKLYSPRQLMAVLLLRVYLKQTYRGVIEVLELSPDLQEVLGLRSLPRHTTLAEFMKREVTPELLAGLMAELVTLLKESGVGLDEVALDSTGLSNSKASAHFISRKGKKATHYTKLSVAVACGTLIAVAMVAGQGPGNDLVDARPVLWQLSGNTRPAVLYADRGYDAEWVHEMCRYGMGTTSYIPPVPKTADGSIKSTLRSLMTRLPERYGRRWHAESFFSAMKRMFGEKLAALSQPMREREALLKALAYSLHR